MKKTEKNFLDLLCYVDGKYSRCEFGQQQGKVVGICLPDENIAIPFCEKITNYREAKKYAKEASKELGVSCTIPYKGEFQKVASNCVNIVLTRKALSDNTNLFGWYFIKKPFYLFFQIIGMNTFGIADVAPSDEKAHALYLIKF